MSYADMILEFPVGMLVTPTDHPAEARNEASHIVVGHSKFDATGSPHNMLLIFPLRGDLRSVPSYLNPVRANNHGGTQ